MAGGLDLAALGLSRLKQWIRVSDEGNRPGPTRFLALGVFLLGIDFIESLTAPGSYGIQQLGRHARAALASDMDLSFPPVVSSYGCMI